jgi:U32 family peptidase
MPVDRPTLPMPALLAPAGQWDCAKAAVENGADAIYFGLEKFNARMRAQNFTESDLPQLMTFLHQRGVKGYVTLNTLVFPAELAEAEQYLRTIIAAGVDAIIVQDVGICRLIRHLAPDFPIHASTQMTVTSAAGVDFVRSLGCQLVVLARECSLAEITKIHAQTQASLPLEVFVHGALCVAYSGQCLTSESLGRSANRGECAQACRLPYDLLADGQVVELGDRKYLLSPQDLAGLEVLPDLIKTGVSCLKIEGRLKTPEYVANVTRVYRQALDQLTSELSVSDQPPLPADRQAHYNLAMAFSRGLYTGWFGGINNQALVHARFGKKRGVYLGQVTQIQNEQVTIRLEAPLKPGDGVVFDHGHPEQEQGGRVYSVDRQGSLAKLTFGRRDVDWSQIHVGDRVWKTSDPDLDRQLRQSFASDTPQFQQPITLEIHGAVGTNLLAIARDRQGHIVQVESAMPLIEAHSQPLTAERLQAQFGRLGNTPFCLGTLTSHLEGAGLLPVSELNRLRRAIVEQLLAQRSQPQRWQLSPTASYRDLLPSVTTVSPPGIPQLIVLVRHLHQLPAALTAGITTVYCEFEDLRKYREAVQLFRQAHPIASAPFTSPSPPRPTIWVAPPRITKPGENWILQQVRSANADGYLIRNYDQLAFFREERCIADFSFNVANPITASYFQQFKLERLTASYDLNITQLTALLTSAPPEWFEITIHQHMPMFHMEHCVFCAFLSTGTDFTNCGRPCETMAVTLRDRVGTEHVLQADAGCRNTVFNGTAQTGAEHLARLMELGARHFRLEFVNETSEKVIHTIQRYRELLQGNIKGSQLWRELKLQNQLGVTRGALR